MFPDLSYFLNYLFGTPVDGVLSIFKTFGLFLVLAFIASATVLKWELRRKEEEGLLKGQLRTFTEGGGAKPFELISNGLLGLILGMKIPLIINDTSGFSQDPSGYLISSKGNLLLGIICAIAFAGVTYYVKNKNKKDKEIKKDVMVMPHERVMDITMVAAISGVIGAKLFSIFENFDDFLQAPIQQLFSGSGLTIYGGLILGFLVTYWYIKRMGLAPIHVIDAVAPALIVGYAIGRMGCQFSGDGDWGIIAQPIPDWFFLPDWMWSFDFPHNVVNNPATSTVMENCGGIEAVGGNDPIYCTKLSEPVYPTSFYETVMGFAIFGILWAIRKRLKVAGVMFFIYLLLNGVERFFIERIRVNPRYDLLNLEWSMSQWIAAGLVVIGIAGILYLRKNGRRLEDMKIA